MRHDLDALAVFSAVAEMRSFQGAASRIGVTRSAVSQTVRRLEDALGVGLFRRTTRSVALTEAGERLHAKLAPALAELRMAVASVADMAGSPRGQVRLAVSSVAEGFLSGPLLAAFAEMYPEVQLDIDVTDEEFDIVARGYDAGVRLGEVIEQDMVAIPVAGAVRQIAVCSPEYRERFGVPEHPRDLQAHRCIGWRPAPGLAPYRWEFEEAGAAFSVDVAPEITTNDMPLMIRLALAGAGITFGMEASFRAAIATGELVPVLESYCPLFPGFYLYHPGRRSVSPGLRALIDHIRSCS